MNYELLKAKADKFFERATPEELIVKFEKLGYIFDAAGCSINWVESKVPQPIKIDYVDIYGPPSFIDRMFRPNKNSERLKNLTSNFSGSFFFFNIAV